MVNLRQLRSRLHERIRADKRSFALYTVLRIIVIITLVRCILLGNYESAALCVLSLVLFLMPAFVEEQFRVEIPPLFEAIIYLFIFAAEILGEINHYYVLIPGWDTMLHAMNGFLCAVVGFSMVYIVSRHSKNLNLSPFYLAFAALCFSMTISTLWEFVEFIGDQLFMVDMQKDYIITSIGSVALDPTNSQTPVRITNIVQTTITTADGATYTIDGGYLDVGIMDTMKDLMVGFAGAVLFSIIGYSYLRVHGTTHEPRHGLLSHLVVRADDDPIVVAERERRKQEKAAAQLARAKGAERKHAAAERAGERAGVPSRQK
jgi:hypothetical protein